MGADRVSRAVQGGHLGHVGGDHAGHPGRRPSHVLWFQKHKPTTPYGEYQWMEVPRGEDGTMTKPDGTTTGPRDGIVLTRVAGSTEVTRRVGRPTVYHEGTNEFCYLPGLPFEDYRPVNAGMLAPAGFHINLSLHYTATELGGLHKSPVRFT